MLLLYALIFSIIACFFFLPFDGLFFVFILERRRALLFILLIWSQKLLTGLCQFSFGSYTFVKVGIPPNRSCERIESLLEILSLLLLLGFLAFKSISGLLFLIVMTDTPNFGDSVLISLMFLSFSFSSSTSWCFISVMISALSTKYIIVYPTYIAKRCMASFTLSLYCKWKTDFVNRIIEFLMFL